MAYLKCLVLSGKVIPEGSTVLPTDDIQIWLHCANIWDKNYTTLSQVLSDSDTLLTLMTTDNAVDYMIRSTTWISDICNDSGAMANAGASDYTAYAMLSNATWCAMVINSSYMNYIINVSVPTMTSATAPKGVASSNSHSYTHNVAYRAFDGNDTTPWGDNAANHWVQYEFTRSQLIKAIYYKEWNTTANANTITIKASNDNSTFIDLDSNATLGNNQTKTIVLSSNTTKYKYLRGLYNGGTSGFYTLQFYGRENGGVQSWLKAGNINKSYTTLAEVLADSTTLNSLMASSDAVDYLVTAKSFIDGIIADSGAMAAIGANNYCANALLNDEDWYNAIKSSAYASSVITVTVPKMTSATTPSGEVFANGYSGSYYPYFAFSQGSTYTSLWMWAGNATNVGYLGYDFQKPVKVVGVMWRNRNNSSSIRPVKALKVQGSNDGTTWTDISSEIQSNGSGQYVQTESHFSNYVAYSKYRVFITDVYDTAAIAIQQLQFYGREDV